MMYQLLDFVSKQQVFANDLVFTGENTPWEVKLDLDYIRKNMDFASFKRTPPSPLKYLTLMPIKRVDGFHPLQNQATPLIKSKSLSQKLGILNLYFKVESKNPTGSFKDRGSAMDIAIAKEHNANAIILASTGNMAASCACYAAAARIPCYVLVPEGLPVTKLAQVIAFNGHVIQVKGSYNDAATLAQIIAMREGFYLAGDYAFRVEGQKTAAYEIIDQLQFQPPDAIVVPIGCGTNIAAYAKGFQEYYSLGLINRIPKLIGVQATGANAVVNSFMNKQKSITPRNSVNTLASAIAVPNPIDGVKALDAIYNTNGMALDVTDEEILQAQNLLAREEGLFVETASAASIAALIKLKKSELKESKQFENQTIVCVLTGDGLKDANLLLKTAAKPPVIYPNAHEFLTLYQQQFFVKKNTGSI